MLHQIHSRPQASRLVKSLRIGNTIVHSFLYGFLKTGFSIPLDKYGRNLGNIFRLYIVIALAACRQIKTLVASLQPPLFGADHILTLPIRK